MDVSSFPLRILMPDYEWRRPQIPHLTAAQLLRQAGDHFNHSLSDVRWLLISQRFRRSKVLLTKDQSHPPPHGLYLGASHFSSNLLYHFSINAWGTIPFTSIYMTRNLGTSKLPCNGPLKIQAPIHSCLGTQKLL